MGGSRANYILVADSKTALLKGKYSGSVIPETLVLGAEAYLNGFHSLKPTDLDEQPYDDLDTEGAVLVDVPRKTVLVGFTLWFSEFHPEVFQEVPEPYQTFSEHQNLRQTFLDLVQPAWPEYCILFADVQSFAVQHCIESDPLKVRLIEAEPDSDVPESEEQIRHTYSQLFRRSLGLYPVGRAALDRLQL
ncbi:hypothetical protein ACFFLM_11965 [Deinococcus oregonensis]|uniref:Uncharacterized protein n=1 Tax=Deinococcus oregonensis TaxID=1805970 RepID=A0ABV6AYV9_9DEIO